MDAYKSVTWFLSSMERAMNSIKFLAAMAIAYMAYRAYKDPQQLTPQMQATVARQAI